MIIFFVTFFVFILAVLGLSIGWLFSQKVLSGSCGGLNNVPGMEGANCSCRNPCEKRLKRMANQQNKQVITFKK